MISRIIIYGIIIGVVLFLLARKIKKHLVVFCVIGLLALAVSVATPAANELSTILDGAEFIGNYEDFGSIYYDENDNMYFVINVNPWDLFESFKKINIDQNIGEIAHIASTITNEMESLIENYK